MSYYGAEGLPNKNNKPEISTFQLEISIFKLECFSFKVEISVSKLNI